MSSAITQKSILRHLENFKHHIYAAYSEKNATEVGLILEHLRKHGLKVYDPVSERIPGKGVFFKWLENGIHKSRITLLFWSKEFRQDELCLYQSENAVLRTSLTKGRHIVICVVINNCKIPALYQQFDPVYAWRWRENPSKALNNVLQSVFVHLRAAKRTHTLGQRASFLVRKKAGGLCQHNSKKSHSSVVNALRVLWNFRKIQTVLENCVLNCQNHGCAYRCSGESIKEFYAHVTSCKFAHVQCSNIQCRQTIMRGQCLKHKRKCRYKKLACPNENCGEEFTPVELKKHQNVCPHRTKTCPNQTFGCKEVFKDTEEHLQTCIYAMVECDLCKTRIIRMELEEHKNQRCPHGPARCPYCQHNVKRLKLESHITKCSVEVTCDNLGCGARMAQGLLQKHKLNCPYETFKCTYPGCTLSATKDELIKHAATCEFRQQRCENCGSDIAIKDIGWHKKFCDRMVECKGCGLSIPASTKTTHDTWQCSKRNLQAFCRDCRMIISYSRLEEHKNNCKPVDIQEVMETASGRAVSKPVGIVRPNAPAQHNKFALPPAEQGIDAYTYPSAFSGLHDSGFHSLPPTSSRVSSPLTRMEQSALIAAIETIPENPEQGNTAIADSSINRTLRNPQSYSLETKEINDWVSVNRITHKIAPNSRNALRAIDDLFYNRQREEKQAKSRYYPVGRKQVISRGPYMYHRW